nr:uncharacterized protein DDB_G0286299-like [Aegilops tauschii subsp. strangulata]
MLVLAPYQPPEKKAKKKAKGAKGGPHRKGASDVTSEDEETRSSATDNDEEEEKENNPPSDGGKRKRVASRNLEAETSKKWKGSLADNSALAHDSSQRSSSRGSLAAKAMASESPPAAHSPKAKGDAEALLLAAASHTVEVSGLKQRLEQAGEELGEMRRQLQEKQGAASEVEALMKALAEAEEKAAKEQVSRKNHETRLNEVQQELQDAVKRC